MTHSLPARPNISRLKKQAKQLLKLYRGNDIAAHELVRCYHPHPEKFSTLRDAQLATARQYGFAGWSELSEAVDDALLQEMSRDQLVDQFIDLACVQYNGNDSNLRYQKANRLLHKNPWLASHNFIAAIISNNLTEVKKALLKDPSLAVSLAAPRNWSPLLYLGYSRIEDQSQEKNALQIASLLLENNADVNDHIKLQDVYHFSVLTGVMGEGEEGISNQPVHQYASELATLLLDAGVNPVQSQGLYNTMFTDSADYWLPILMRYGLNKNSLADWADSKRPTTLFNYLLGTAVSRDKQDRVKFLLKHGADANAQCFYTERQMITIARVNRHEAIASMLTEAGAAPAELSISEQFMLAVVNGSREEIAQLVVKQPSLLHQPDLIQGASVSTFKQLLELGLDINKQDDKGKNVMHLLAVHGKLEQIKFLIEQGARVDIRDYQYEGTVVAWAHFNNQMRVRDYILKDSENTVELSACGFLPQLKQMIKQNPELARLSSPSGNTPLHVVCNWLGAEADYDIREQIMKLLLENGADIHAKNNDGLTALDLYKKINDEDNIDLLTEHAALI